MLIEQLMHLKKVRNENLKIRIDLWDLVLDGWTIEFFFSKIFKFLQLPPPNFPPRLPSPSQNPKP